MEMNLFSPLDEALFEQRIIQMDGGVDSRLAHKVNKQLLALEAKDSKKPVFLFINSPGGEINSGFSIYDTARFIECPVYTVVVGLAASMGSLIALLAPVERRVGFPNSKYLVHQPLISGHIYGSASEIEISARDILRTKEKINQLYARETGKSIEQITEVTDRDYWMTAQEAKEFGLISKIVENRKELMSLVK